MKSDILVDVKFFSTKENGRKIPTPSNFFNCVFVYKNKNYDCRLLLKDIGSINPGEQKIVPIIFFSPELIKNELEIDDTFFIWESKNIAQGKIIEIID